MGNHDPTWHTAREGEIFQTDGVLTSKRYHSDSLGGEFFTTLAVE